MTRREHRGEPLSFVKFCNAASVIPRHNVSRFSRWNFDISTRKLIGESAVSIVNRNVDGHSAIVVVDDDAALRAYIKLVLQHDDFDVIDFPDAMEALAALLNNPAKISAGIANIDMPGLDGIAFARVMRKRLPDTPILMISIMVQMKHSAHSFSYWRNRSTGELSSMPSGSFPEWAPG